MISFIKPGHVLKLLLLIEFAKIDLAGGNQDECRYCASSICVCFLRIIMKRYGLVFITVAEVYDALSGMVGSV